MPFLLFSFYCCKPTEPDQIPPHVTITYPINGSIVSELVCVTCVASDNTGIKKVSLWIDGRPVNGVEDETEPYELIWDTRFYLDQSEHTITVRATDKADNVTDSNPIVVKVDNTNSYPIPVNIKSIKYQNESFIITWERSVDTDFYSYTLFESLAGDMRNKNEIYSTFNIDDTTFIVLNVTNGERRYYQIVVTDSLGFSKAGPVATAYALEAWIPSDGLVGYYPMNGNLYDESGKGNHGVIFGATFSYDRFGHENSACYFDGQDDYIWINESSSLESDDFSVALWMKIFSLTFNTYQTLLIKEDGWNDGYKVVVRTDRTDFLADKMLFTVSGPLENNDGLVNLHSTSSIEKIDTWYHITVTYQKAGLMKIYINGCLDAEVQGPVSWDKENSYELVLGRHSNNGATSYGGYLWGAIDNLLIYNRVLTEQEIQLIYMYPM